MILHPGIRFVKFFLIFFDDLNFQIIELDGFDEGVLAETGFGMPPELLDIVLQPDRLAEIEFQAYFMQRVEYFMRPRIVGIVADHRILQQPVVAKRFCPQTEHGKSLPSIVE